jgi:hypothetical protein
LSFFRLVWMSIWGRSRTSRNHIANEAQFPGSSIKNLSFLEEHLYTFQNSRCPQINNNIGDLFFHSASKTDSALHRLLSSAHLLTCCIRKREGGLKLRDWKFSLRWSTSSDRYHGRRHQRRAHIFNPELIDGKDSGSSDSPTCRT